MRRRAGVMAIGLATPLLAVCVLALSVSPQADANDVTIDVAIDVDMTGNGDNVLGPTESCNATPMQVGDTIDVDIVVRGIPAYVPSVELTGIQGFDMDLLFDAAVVHVTRVHSFQEPTIVKAPSTEASPHFDYISYNRHLDDSPPGVTGDTSISLIKFSAKSVGGDGVLTRVTLEAVGTGRTRLAATYTLTSSPNPQIYDASGSQLIYEVNNSGATIVVGNGNCSPPTPTTHPIPITDTPGPSPEEPTPTTNPVPPTLETAIDVDTTGNGDNTLGPTESCNEAALRVGDSIDIDVVVKGVPPFEPGRIYTGIRGYEFNLLFDEDILEVTRLHGIEGPTILRSGGDFFTGEVHVVYNYSGSGPAPGVSGDSFVSIVSSSGASQNGDGVLSRVTLKAIHSGVSRLSLGQTLKGDSVPGIFEATSLNEYQVDDMDAAIVVGAGDCNALPTPTPTRMPTSTRPPPATRQTPTAKATPSKPTPTLTPTPTVETAKPTLTPSRLPDTGGPPDLESSLSYTVAGLMSLGLVVIGSFAYARRRL